MYWRKLQKKLTNYNIKEELEEIMRSISSAIISFVIFYIGLCLPKDERKQRMTRGCLFYLSFIMLIIAFTLMILGLWWNDDFRLRKVKYMEFYPTNEYREVTLQVGLNSVQLGNTDKLFSDGLEEDEYIYFDDSKGFSFPLHPAPFCCSSLKCPLHSRKS